MQVQASKRAPTPAPQRSKHKQPVKQRKDVTVQPWRSKLLELFQPNLGTLRLAHVTDVQDEASRTERHELRHALHGLHTALVPEPQPSRSPHRRAPTHQPLTDPAVASVGLAGVDEGPLAHCLELQGPAGLWARDALFHTAAMFLYGTVPQALRHPRPPVPVPAHQQQQTEVQPGAGPRAHSLQQLWQQPAEQAIAQPVGGAHRHRRGVLSAAAASATTGVSAHVQRAGAAASSGSRQRAVLPWGGFASMADPLVCELEGLVGPDWLYDLPPPGAGISSPKAKERLPEIVERVREAWCPSRVDQPPRGSLEAVLMDQVALEQQTPVYYEAELPPGCDPSTWPLTPTSLLRVPRDVYKQGSLLQAPRLPRLNSSSPPPSSPQPPPPYHIFWAVSHQDLEDWTAQPHAGTTREVQLLINRVLGIVHEGPCDSLGLLVGGGKPVWASRGMAAEMGVSGGEQGEGGGDREGRSAGGEGGGARVGGSEGWNGEGGVRSDLKRGQESARRGAHSHQQQQQPWGQELVQLTGHDVEEGAGAAAVRTTVRALRITLRQKYASNVHLHVYAPRAVLRAPLGPAIVREGVQDMDVPYYMMAVQARNQRLFGRRRRLWRDWADTQGSQYRYLERFRDPWREAKEEVEELASFLLMGAGSRDYPALLARLYESDLMHAAQTGRMPINWRRKQWRQQVKAQRQRKQQGKPSAEALPGVSNEESEVLGALAAYRDLLARPQRGSPGRLVLKHVTLQEMLQNLCVSVHPTDAEAVPQRAMQDMQAYMTAQQSRVRASQQAGIAVAANLPDVQAALLPDPQGSQVHAIVLTDDPAVEDAVQGRASVTLSWEGMVAGHYLPGSRVSTFFGTGDIIQ